MLGITVTMERIQEESLKRVIGLCFSECSIRVYLSRAWGKGPSHAAILSRNFADEREESREGLNTQTSLWGPVIDILGSWSGRMGGCIIEKELREAMGVLCGLVVH